MSPIVKIPDMYKPNFETTINGKNYSFPAGRSVEVPDEVASVVTNIQNLAPTEEPGAGRNTQADIIGVIDRNITRIDIPKGTAVVGTNAFSYCLALSSVTMHEGLITIASFAFSKAAAIKNIDIPSTVMNVGNGAFDLCTGLERVVFRGVPNFVSASAFSDCTALKDIYVPWAQGAVADAPWGAASAVIHYNSKVNPGA